jgi:hypothetical protein
MPPYHPSARNTRRTSSRWLGSRQATCSNRTASFHSRGPSGWRWSLRNSQSTETPHLGDPLQRVGGRLRPVSYTITVFLVTPIR